MIWTLHPGGMLYSGLHLKGVAIICLPVKAVRKITGIFINNHLIHRVHSVVLKIKIFENKSFKATTCQEIIVPAGIVQKIDISMLLADNK